jgi:biopolymer transport protein ExbD
VSLRAPGRGGLRHQRRGVGAVVDLTPLIDITFQLLIFFLLTATVQQANPSFKVKLPKAKNQDVSQDTKALVVHINAEGEYQVDGNVVDPRELEMRMCTAAQAGNSAGVNIKADEATSHKYVVKVMDLAKVCGLEKLGILHGR